MKSYLLGSTLVLIGLLPCLSVHAQISGFTPSSYTLNGGPTISSNVLTLTDGGGGEARSAYFNTKQDITNFTAQFTYQDVGGGGADGVTFVLQNAGINALGSAGSGLGYAGIGTSAAVEFNIYSGNGGSQTGFQTNGAIGYSATPGVDITSGHLIQVDLGYNGTTLTEKLTDLSTLGVYNTSYATNLSSLGANTAFVGFTGGTGAAVSTQRISNFTYTPVTPEPGTLALVGSLGLAGLGFLRRKSRRK